MSDNQIHYWAHMLDESHHASYYDVYMQENPEDFIDVAGFEKEMAEEDLPKSFINSHIKIRKRVFDHEGASIVLDEEQKPTISVLENN